MKNVLFLALLSLPIVSHSFEVEFETEPDKEGSYITMVKCANGASKPIPFSGSGAYDPFYAEGSGTHRSLEEAANAACGSSKIYSPKKVYRLKDDVLVCSGREEFRSRLSSKGTYGMSKTNIKYGGPNKGCFISDSSSRVKIIEHYENETYNNKYDNGERQWTEEVDLIDSYFKVESGGSYYYVRRSAVSL